MISSPDDVWYAVANTEVILPLKQRLETFGSTIIHYHLLAEKMDSVNEIRIREGKVHAERPQLLTPAYFERLLLDGFGEDTKHYTDWLQSHFRDLTFLKYGFRFRHEEGQESIIHENLEEALARVKSHVEQKGDPLTAVIKGVDDAWEICLLKFATDTIRHSVPQNIMDLKKHKMLEQIEGIPRAVREEIEQDFQAAGKDESTIKALGTKLQYYGIFEAYEDRFYQLIRRIQR